MTVITSFVCFVSLQEHAYPADELMPLTCRGRVRGQEPSRGDVDDALGKSVFETLSYVNSYVQFAACKTCLFSQHIQKLNIENNSVGAHKSVICLKSSALKERKKKLLENCDCLTFFPVRQK